MFKAEESCVAVGMSELFAGWWHRHPALAAARAGEESVCWSGRGRGWRKGRERRAQAAKPPISVRVGPAGADGQQHRVQPLGSSWPASALCLGSPRAFTLQQKKTLVSSGSTAAVVCSCAALITFP